MKIKFLLFIFLSATACLKSQPVIQWEKSLGGNIEDLATCVQQTSDSGYIIAGYSFSDSGSFSNNHGNDDYWIVKLDKAENIQWKKLFGGSSYEYAYCIQQTSDEGYIIAGESSSNNGNVTGNHGSGDCWILRLDSLGSIKWEKSFGGTEGDAAQSVQQTSDGGFIIAGSSASKNGDVSHNHGQNDYWVVKLNNEGNIDWENSFGGTKDDVAYSVKQTSDGGYIVAGTTSSNDKDVLGFHGYYDYWVVKLNSEGHAQWTKCLGGLGDDEATSIQQTSDGGYIVAGRAASDNNGDVTGNHGGYDYWIVKLDKSGNLKWEKSLGGTDYDIANSIQQTSDGGYIIAGQSLSSNGDVNGNRGGTDYWIVKLDHIGNIQWQQTYGGSSGDGANSIEQTLDGGYIIAGYSYSNDKDVTGNHGNGFPDYWIVKLSPDILPITLLNFDGIIENNQTILKWSTANEMNNKGFEVQKSLNGQNFTKIGFVTSHGNSSQVTNYNFFDAKLLSGSNYYRLKQIDNDGKFSYSSIINLDFTKFDWSVLSNPSNNVWVQLQLDKTAKVSIQVISINGKITQTINKGNISVGTYSVPVNLNHASSGVYIIQLHVDDKTYSKKIIKL